MRNDKSKASAETTKFLKKELAEKLRAQIIAGGLIPGQRIVESFWAARFRVAQISVREAINLLIADGFVTKATGRSARVTNYTKIDIAEIYELRGALEGLAVRLATERRAEVALLRKSVAEMQTAIQRGDMQRLLDADMQFHLQLCEMSGNHILAMQARTLLVPLFAFVAMRVAQMNREPQVWKADIVRHARIVDLIDEGDPATAEFAVRAALSRFAERARDIWEADSPSPVKQLRSTYRKQKRET
jgi:GntR family transcriptional regulator, trigonelline degradation regulator